MIIRTEAIVLKCLNYSETSKIVQLFTKNGGHVTVIAKGARKSGSKFGSCLEPTAIIEAIYYYKSERDIQTLSDSSHLTRLKHLSTSLERYSAAIRSIEFLSKLEINSSYRRAVFQMVSLILEILDTTEADPRAIWNCMRLRLLSLLGFAASFDKADVESVGEGGGILHLPDGSISSENSESESEMMLRSSRLSLRSFAILSRADISHVIGLETPRLVMDELDHMVTAYVAYHLPHIPKSRASLVLEAMKV